MSIPIRPDHDRDPDTHALRIVHAAGVAADQFGDYVDRGLERLLGQMTFLWIGRCNALDAQAKTANVTLDPLPVGFDGSRGTITAAWGRASWNANDIVGKRVRVGFNPLLGYWFVFNVAANE